LLVDHEFVDLDGRLLPVVQFGVFDGVVERRQLVLSFTVRLQAVLEHLTAGRREPLLERTKTGVQEYKCTRVDE